MYVRTCVCVCVWLVNVLIVFLMVMIDDRKIRPCPSTNPGCVSTNAKSSSFAFPWVVPETSKENAVQELQEAILKTQKNAKIEVVEDTPNGKYIQAEVDGGFGPDVMEFLVKGDVVTYRSMAMKVTYIYPFTTAIGDSKGQLERLKKIVDQLGCNFLSNATPVVDSESGGRHEPTPAATAANATLLTPKEFMVLSKLVTRGITVFLEDDPLKISEIKADFNGTRIYNVKYQIAAKKAYNLLKHARKNPACSPTINLLNQSSCKLALRNLPEDVYKLKWDVVVVDGPIGDTPEAPGRMPTIYTAGMLARTDGIGKKTTTDVVVHDVHRTIEKWFSWEFFCEQNLVSARGKLWVFRIPVHQSNSTSFCSSETVVNGGSI
uniref:Uncharacterized protein n=1 Tax=Gossypium raimondii TaxID=29730 RepID=A0A0D2SE03_GOSRA|nr:hypothetical protein B456_007G042800 [Gossypium raimondii]